MWRRRLFVWEENLVNNLMEELEGFTLSLEENEWRWKLEEGVDSR